MILVEAPPIEIFSWRIHDCSDFFRLEQHRRVGFAPTEKRRLCTAHTNFCPYRLPI
jgi:hypothetical protein